MRRYIFFLTLFHSLLLCLSCSSGESQATLEEEQQGAPSLVTQMRQCSRLYTTEYRIHKIVTHDDVLRLKGNLLSQKIDIPLPLGERKVAIPMDATLKAYIDFSNFSDDDIERDGKHITILLPDPKVVMTSSKINQKEVREYVGLTRAHFTDKELTAYEQQGRQAILNSIPELGILEQAQANAARVLVPMLTEMGYQEEDITIAFRKDLDLSRLIDFKL